MLSVLMKYDFKRLWKLAALLCGGVTVATVVNCLLTWWVDSIPESEYGLNLFEMSLYMLIGMLTLAVSVAMWVMLVFIFYYYYKNLMTDEGYLTFTLPTTPGKILLSKFIVSLCCYLLVTFFVYAGTYVVNMFNYYLLHDYGGLIGSVEEEVLSSGEIVEYLLTPVTAIANGAYTIMSVFMAITIGSCVAKRNKVAASIAFYFLLSFGMGLLETVLALIIQIMSDDSMDYTFLSNLNSGIIIGISVAVTVLYYFLSRQLLNRKLNLQ
ncbi:MAG: hypothetical protein ACI3XR_06975 [Eubacteriales bacterium]